MRQRSVRTTTTTSTCARRWTRTVQLDITGNHAKPNWLTPDQADRCFASPAGWVLHRKDGTQELLVAVKGLSLAAKLGTTVIDKLTWATGVFGRSQAQTIKVRFDQQVV